MEVARDYPPNIALLQKKFQKELWYNTFFSRFAGFADVNSGENGQKAIGYPTGNVVTVYTEFASQGRDHMLVPFLKDLTGDLVYGDTTLVGTGEKQVIDFLRIYINQARKAVEAKSGNMSNQRIKLYDMISKATPQLRKYLAKAENAFAFQAIYEGASDNITKAQTSEGIGLSKRYHPNMYYASSTTAITTVGTEKHVKTTAQIAAAADIVDAASTFIIGATIVEKLAIKAMELKIPQIITKDGHSFWLMVVSPEQMRQLKADSKIYGANREATSAKWLNSPELQGFNEVLYYSGIVFVSDIIGVRSWNGTTDTFGGTTGWYEAPSGNNNCAILLGSNSIAKGIGEDWHYTTEMYDHDNVKEIGAASILGYNRMEYATVANEGTVFATSVAGAVVADTAVINQSSLILMTYV